MADTEWKEKGSSRWGPAWGRKQKKAVEKDVTRGLTELLGKLKRKNDKLATSGGTTEVVPEKTNNNPTTATASVYPFLPQPTTPLSYEAVTVVQDPVVPVKRGVLEVNGGVLDLNLPQHNDLLNLVKCTTDLTDTVDKLENQMQNTRAEMSQLKGESMVGTQSPSGQGPPGPSAASLQLPPSQSTLRLLPQPQSQSTPRGGLQVRPPPFDRFANEYAPSDKGSQQPDYTIPFILMFLSRTDMFMPLFSRKKGETG